MYVCPQFQKLVHVNNKETFPSGMRFHVMTSSCMPNITKPWKIKKVANINNPSFSCSNQYSLWIIHFAWLWDCVALQVNSPLPVNPHVAYMFSTVDVANCQFLGGSYSTWCGAFRITSNWQAHHDSVIKWKHFRVTSPLWGESSGHRWITLTRLWCFLWSTL